MMETERIRIYPVSREQMEKTIAAEADEDTRKAYTEMLKALAIMETADGDFQSVSGLFCLPEKVSWL